MCVATMETPAPGFHFGGIVNANRALWLLLRNLSQWHYAWLANENSTLPRVVILPPCLQVLFPVILLPDLSRQADKQ